jgi:HEPN domain-containing protein
MRRNQNEEVVREWLAKAEEDFGFACSALEINNYFSPICFHFQQAAEKYLKTFIIANKLEFRSVHNLLELLEICKQNDPRFKEIEEAARYLNPFYIDTRYPVHWPSQYNREIVLKAKEYVIKIREVVKKRLKF